MEHAFDSFTTVGAARRPARWFARDLLEVTLPADSLAAPWPAHTPVQLAEQPRLGTSS